MPKTPFESVMSDNEVMEEFRRRIDTPRVRSRADEFNVNPESLRATAESAESGLESAPGEFTEAIVLEFGRPALLIQNDTFDLPDSDVWKERLLPTRSNIERAIRSVGRLEVLEHPTFDWIGTAWLVSEDVAVTNRHVANEFAQRKSDAFVFRSNPFGRRMRAFVDFKEEFSRDVIPEQEVEVTGVLHIEELGSEFPDLALIKLRRNNGLPEPIELSTRAPDDSLIAVIGYPARDSRNGLSAMIRVFGDIYDVKRLAPGKVVAFDHDLAFTHDCSTLGGNSGSAVIDIDDGRAIGLHFGGRFQSANFAVKAGVVERRLRDLSVSISVPDTVTVEEIAERREISEYEGREGFRHDFLGNDFQVALPKLGESLQRKAAPVAGGGHVLHYEHFSVAMNKERRLAFFTACNVDGNQLRRFPRGRDKWYVDPRIDDNHQVDNVLYRNNDLDRGHLVRRLDPVWGSQSGAELAQDDTFHYTNAAPQHKDLNRRIWLDLEDHILDNVDIHDLKVSVMSGPVFRENDRVHRGIKIPTEFWKVVALVKEPEIELSATGYLLSQADMITGLEFAFGPFRTFQISIADVETRTGLDFGALREHDPLIAEAAGARELVDLERIVI